MDPNNNATPPAPQDQGNSAPQNNTPPAPSEDDEWTAAEANFAIDKGNVTPVKREDNNANGNKQVQSNTDANADPNAVNGSSKTGQEGADDNNSGKKVGNDDDGKNGEGAGDSDNGQAAKTEENADDNNRGEYTPPTRAEIEADRKQTMDEVREQLYPDLETELTDADGEPIKSIEDVMKLRNPNTGKAFTETEAAAWLLKAQQHLNKQVQEAQAEVERVAEVHLSLKEQAARIRDKYGALLEANPNGIREKVYASYQRTLKLDEKSKLILDAPVSMEEHYEAMLEPYERLAAQMEANTDKQEQNQQTQQNQKTQQQQQVQQTKQTSRSDRQDIIGGGKTNTKDPEEAEWEQAAKAYYEG